MPRHQVNLRSNNLGMQYHLPHGEHLLLRIPPMDAFVTLPFTCVFAISIAANAFVVASKPANKRECVILLYIIFPVDYCAAGTVKSLITRINQTNELHFFQNQTNNEKIFCLFNLKSPVIATGLLNLCY